MQLSADDGETPPTVRNARVAKAPPTVPEAKLVKAPPTVPEVRVPQAPPPDPEARAAGMPPPVPEAPAEQAGATRLLRLFGLIAAAVLLIGLAQTPPGHSLLRLTGLARPQTSYSALSFTEAGGLPAKVASGHVGLNVSFAVHNATASSNTYRWTVEVVHGKTTRSAAEGTVTIPQGGTTTQTRRVSVLCRTGTLEVVVRLAAPAESIHFRAACGG